MTLVASELVGAWTLASFVITFDDGRAPLFPFGEDATGQLLYTASGRMSAVLSRADRPGFGIARLEQATAATAEQKADAFDSYLSYAGRYRVEGETVFHDVDFSLAPDTVGHVHARRATLDGETLTLAYDLTSKSGVRRDYTLTWTRIS